MGGKCGPYRIRRHDILRDIVNYHALKLDNSNVKIEQQVNGDSNTRPGDIYHNHPDFDNGKPAFFNISVSTHYNPAQYTLQLLMLVQLLRSEKLRKIVNIF